MTQITGNWLTARTTQSALRLLRDASHQAYLVGGCVRNALLDVPISDIDIATDAHPKRVMSLAKDAGLKVIATGIDHGTVTVVIDSIAHEITTFRNDIATDGRHAQVQFSDTIKEDAARRDFTVNALYADHSGVVYDPVGGLPDIERRLIRFIGDASARISEDYLRILRFFRFHAVYGDATAGIDPEGLAACAAGADGMARLSGERIGAEMKKLLAAADPAPSIAAMAQSGVLGHVMPGADPRSLAPLIHLEDGRPPNWQRRAAILGGEEVNSRWRLSKSEAKSLAILRDSIGSDQPVSEIAYRQDASTAWDTALLRAASFEQPVPDLSAVIEHAAEAVFPIKAADLMPNLSGPALGEKLADLEKIWIASDFQMTRAQLLVRS